MKFIAVAVLVASAVAVAHAKEHAAEETFDVDRDCKGNCRCPAGHTLIVEPSELVPAQCENIRFTRRVKCHSGKGAKKVVGACVARTAYLRPYCQLPEYLLNGCKDRKGCKGENCGAIAIKGEEFACLKRVATPKQCKDVCPCGFDPQCFEVKGLGCREISGGLCADEKQPQKEEVLIENSDPASSEECPPRRKKPTCQKECESSDVYQTRSL